MKKIMHDSKDVLDSNTFIKELWAGAVMDSLQKSLEASVYQIPKRDKYTQALRDAAFGHPEYPKTSEEVRNGQLYYEYIQWRKKKELEEIEKLKHSYLNNPYKLFDSE